MTQEEYKQKRHECWIEYFGSDDYYPASAMQQCFYFAFDRAYALGQQDAQLLNNPKQLDANTVIQGWVARDKDGTTCFYSERPKRMVNEWDSDCSYMYSIPKDLFPDLTWDDDPEPVEITIKRKKNEK